MLLLSRLLRRLVVEVEVLLLLRGLVEIELVLVLLLLRSSFRLELRSHHSREYLLLLLHHWVLLLHHWVILLLHHWVLLLHHRVLLLLHHRILLLLHHGVLLLLPHQQGIALHLLELLKLIKAHLLLLLLLDRLLSCRLLVRNSTENILNNVLLRSWLTRPTKNIHKVCGRSRCCISLSLRLI